MDFFTSVTVLSLEADFVPDVDPDVIAFNSKAQMPHLKGYEFELYPIVFVGKTVSIPCAEVVGEGLK